LLINTIPPELHLVGLLYIICNNTCLLKTTRMLPYQALKSSPWTRSDCTRRIIILNFFLIPFPLSFITFIPALPYFLFLYFFFSVLFVRSVLISFQISSFLCPYKNNIDNLIGVDVNCSLLHRNKN